MYYTELVCAVLRYDQVLEFTVTTLRGELNNDEETSGFYPD
jgi:hypothetical protein